MNSKIFNYFRKTKVSLNILNRKNKSENWSQIRHQFISKSNNDSSTSAITYLYLLIPSTTFCLGCWQVYRRRWKLDLINQLQTSITEPPIDLPQDLNELNDLEYRRVRLRGRFDNSMEMFISPRSLITANESQTASLMTTKSINTSGVWVITPFQLKDSKDRILVNRGWIPRNKMSQKSRLEGQTDEEMELIGVVRNTEKRQQFGFKNDIKSKIWHYRDIQGLAQLMNTLPIFVDADYDSTIPGGPIGGQTRVSLRNEHLSYIITWYGLTIIIFQLWYSKMYKIKPKINKF